LFKTTTNDVSSDIEDAEINSLDLDSVHLEAEPEYE